MCSRTIVIGALLGSAYSLCLVGNCKEDCSMYSCMLCNDGFMAVAHEKGTRCEPTAERPHRDQHKKNAYEDLDLFGKTCTIANCSECHVGICTQCESGYDLALDFKTCNVSNPNPCFINNCESGCNATKCGKCKTGFAPNEFGYGCQKVAACNAANCKSCSTSGICQECETGYQLDVNTSTCNQSNHASCAVDHCYLGCKGTVCQLCEQGWTLETHHFWNGTKSYNCKEEATSDSITNGWGDNNGWSFLN